MPLGADFLQCSSIHIYGRNVRSLPQRRNSPIVESIAVVGSAAAAAVVVAGHACIHNHRETNLIPYAELSGKVLARMLESSPYAYHAGFLLKAYLYFGRRLDSSSDRSPLIGICSLMPPRNRPAAVRVTRVPILAETHWHLVRREGAPVYSTVPLSEC